MPGDTELEGYNAWNGGFNLDGYRLTIGSGGINIYENNLNPAIYGGGCITSSSSTLNFDFKGNSTGNGYVIHSSIVDCGDCKVGLNITGGAPGYRSHIDLVSGVSNTFTGDVFISSLAGLLLNKANGATAVRGNITVSDGGYLLLCGNNQISDSSIVRLDGRKRAATFFFSVMYDTNISEQFSRLQVAGAGVLDWHYSTWDGGHMHGPHYLYLDDLEIEWGGKLTVKNWALSRDYLLVRKDSEHLEEALSRIKFEGHWEWQAALKYYNEDYWQIIPGIPEPATCGAALGAAGLGLWLIRRKPKRTTAQK